ncbi:MAG TPA: hypothetical protein VD861_08550, partial [Pyrinomonadaceae bacterium]|nr:hypothetical protein [Pyrinomonadaceae bacterium]
MRQKFLSLSLVFVLALGCAAQQKRADDSAPSVERLRAHVSYLASDALEGRRTGTKGARAAAMYVAEQFARYKLRPARKNAINFDQYEEFGSYMQAFPFVAGVELGMTNAFVVTPQPQQGGAAGVRPAPVELRVGEDWMPLGFSSNASLTALPAVFVNFGIKADELSYDDYSNVPVKGRAAVAFSGSPDGDNPHGQFARHAD